MKSILHVKNFGPIKDAKLDLRNVNVLIGPQASGKSTLAKLFTICKSPLMYFELEEGKFSNRRKDGDLNIKLDKPSYSKLLESLDFFSLTGYINSRSEISFESPTHSLYLKNGKLKFQDNLEVEKLVNFFREDDIIAVENYIAELRKKSDSFNFDFALELFWTNKSNPEDRKVDETFIREFIDFTDNLNDREKFQTESIPYFINAAIQLRSSVYNNNAIYIPAERTIVNLLKQAAFNFQRIKVPIPGHLLEYAARYEAASFAVKKVDLGFLSKGTKYRNVNGEDRIYYSQRKSIQLADSASGFQSVVPMILPLIHSYNDDDDFGQYSFVIEEPETNLFPEAQYETIKFIEGSRQHDFGFVDDGAMHIYTTHSPFILTSLNNMLFAFKKGFGAEEKVQDNIDLIISEENWIDPEDFSAYEIKNGKAKSIFNRKTGLISESVIDVVSEEIMNDFRKIAVASTLTNAK